jgi:hypothetical protein
MTGTAGLVEVPVKIADDRNADQFAGFACSTAP